MEQTSSKVKHRHFHPFPSISKVAKHISFQETQQNFAELPAEVMIIPNLAIHLQSADERKVSPASTHTCRTAHGRQVESGNISGKPACVENPPIEIAGLPGLPIQTTRFVYLTFPSSTQYPWFNHCLTMNWPFINHWKVGYPPKTTYKDFAV